MTDPTTWPTPDEITAWRPTPPPTPVELTVTDNIVVGPPPKPFDYWPDYFNSVDKTGVLSGLRISAISPQPPQAGEGEA